MNRLEIAKRAMGVAACALKIKLRTERTARNKKVCEAVHLKQVNEVEKSLETVLKPFFNEQLKSAAMKLAKLSIPDNEKAVKNCGTGDGGFKPGNVCARGGGQATKPITDPKEAASAIAKEVLTSLHTYKAKGFDVPSEQEIHDNWLKLFRSRKENVGDKPAFKDLTPELGHVISKGMVENNGNSKYQEFVSKHGDAPVIYRRPEKGMNGAAEWRGAIHIYDGSFWKDEGTDSFKPGQATAGASGGYAAVIRHEYGHKLHEKLSADQQKAWMALLPDSSVVKKELTSYAAKNAEEAFCELFAIATHPNYKSGGFPKWVDDLHEKQKEWLLK